MRRSDGRKDKPAIPAAMVNDRLAIIIPAYSGYEQLRHCLESLYNSQYSDFDVVVVDHGDTDELTSRVRAAFPRTTCIRGTPDLWWSGASNLGIRHALNGGSKLIMLLNHDCYVHDDTIEKLLLCMETTANAIITPVQHNLYTNKDTIGALSFFLLGFPTIVPPAAWYRRLYSQPLVPTHLILGGRDAVMRANIFQDTGYFDEINLPHYGADHDFYLRCRSAGIRLFVCTDSIVDIDDTQTTIAETGTVKTLAEFTHTLRDRSSHRNIRDLYTLFSRHYPVPRLAPLGVALNIMRYFFVYMTKSVLRTLKSWHCTTG